MNEILTLASVVVLWIYVNEIPTLDSVVVLYQFVCFQEIAFHTNLYAIKTAFHAHAQMNKQMCSQGNVTLQLYCITLHYIAV